MRRSWSGRAVGICEPIQTLLDRLSQGADLVFERAPLRLIVIARAGLSDLRGGQIQLRLAELDDGAEAEIVAALRELERHLGLIQQLVGQAEPLIAIQGVEVGDLNIADHAVLEILDALLGAALTQFRLSAPRLKEAAIEDGDVYVGPDSAVLILQRRDAHRNQADV